MNRERPGRLSELETVKEFDGGIMSLLKQTSKGAVPMGKVDSKEDHENEDGCQSRVL